MVVPTTPINVEYEEFMHGVDVIDQLHTTYSMQMSSHKWWLKVFIFGLDQSIVNTYIMYLKRCSELGQKSLSHMNFNIAIVDYIVGPQIAARKQKGGLPRPRCSVKEKGPHGLEVLSKRRFYVKCGRK